MGIQSSVVDCLYVKEHNQAYFVKTFFLRYCNHINSKQMFLEAMELMKQNPMLESMVLTHKADALFCCAYFTAIDTLENHLSIPDAVSFLMYLLNEGANKDQIYNLLFWELRKFKRNNTCIVELQNEYTKQLRGLEDLEILVSDMSITNN